MHEGGSGLDRKDRQVLCLSHGSEMIDLSICLQHEEFACFWNGGVEIFCSAHAHKFGNSPLRGIAGSLMHTSG